MDNDLKATVQRQFGQVAANYLHSEDHSQGAGLDWLKVQVQATPYARVLDVGCGVGHTSLTIAPYVGHVTALDLTENMLNVLESLTDENNIHNIEAKSGDAENMPLPDAAYDLVVSRYSAHHWQTPGKALAEISRVLKPSGRFILIDGVSFDAPAEDTYLQSLELIRDVSHVRYHAVSQWVTLFAEHAFMPPAIQRWTLALDFEAWTERMAVPSHRKRVLCDLLDVAPNNIQSALKIDGYNFALPVALFDTHKRA
jgi:ubiquinone/menaquinone biosynthesis C-methylase UbiE